MISNLISVVIPVYNVQDFLPRCIDSVINNTFEELEIICVDDGSTDNSLKILRHYEKKDSRIKVITKNNGGLSSARNEGLKYCTGEFVAFIDSDDWIHKEYFAMLLEVQKKGAYDIVVGNHCRTTDDNCMDYKIGSYKVQKLNQKTFVLYHKKKGYVWGRIYRRKCIEGLLFDIKEKIEDALFNMMVTINNPELNVAYMDLPIYAYYIRDNSLVTYIDSECVMKLATRFYQCAQMIDDKELCNVIKIEIISKRKIASTLTF